jgi:hypothetical protein
VPPYRAHRIETIKATISSFIQTVTVGIGNAPILRLNRQARADYTADREFHPALKTFYLLADIIPLEAISYNSKKNNYTL